MKLFSNGIRGILLGMMLIFPSFWGIHELAAQDVPHLSHRTDSIIRSRLTPRQDSIFSVRREQFKKKHIELEKRYRTIKLDTNYIQRPKERLTLRALNNVSIAAMNAKMTSSTGIHGNFETKSDFRNTITFGANYLGIGLSIALNPAKVFGKRTSTEFNFNNYGNTFGIDVIYLNNNSYNGEQKVGGNKYEINRGSLSNKSLTIDGYYVFNGKKFSYPAAFSQTYKQVKSAGSIMAGVSYYRSNLTNHAQNDYMGVVVRKLSISQFAIGAGYAYNWVPSRRWLIHGSAMPFFGVYRHNRIHFENKKQKMPYRFPEMQMVGRVAVIYNVKQYFWGGSGVFNFFNSGDRKQLLLENFKMRIRLIFGIRI